MPLLAKINEKRADTQGLVPDRAWLGLERELNWHRVSRTHGHDFFASLCAPAEQAAFSLAVDMYCMDGF